MNANSAKFVDKNSTPRKLLESLANAVTNRDFEQVVACLEPGEVNQAEVHRKTTANIILVQADAHEFLKAGARKYGKKEFQ